jgi:Kef-type K+ transport system membrane component KefB
MEVIFTILFILATVWGVGLLFEKFGWPLILGELLAGLFIGPPILGLVGGEIKAAVIKEGVIVENAVVREGIIGEPIFHWDPAMGVLATLGMFFLMFYAGLITDPKELKKHVKSFFGVGVAGTIAPLFLGCLVAWFITGGNFWATLLVGIAISGTSLVTKVRILGDLGILKSRIGYTMMGGAMVDNIFTFIILAVALKAITVGIVGPLDVIYTAALVVAFFGIALFLGYRVYPRVKRWFVHPGARGFMFALIMGLLIAGIGQVMGVHFIIGAYLAGLFVREEIVGEAFQDLNQRFQTLSHGFLGPIFIMSVAFYVSFGVLKTHALLLIALILAAVMGKVIGAGGGAYLTGLKKREALTIGIGMNGRGTVELVLAMVLIDFAGRMGISLGLAETCLSLLVFTAFVTTLMTPIGLRYMLRR